MKHVLIKLIRGYQARTRGGVANPLLLGGVSGCRSWPTCSEYAIDVIERDGVLKGSFRAIIRVAKCNPLWPAHIHG
jgi:putative membrane protein insertion efficiency factor